MKGSFLTKKTPTEDSQQNQKMSDSSEDEDLSRFREAVDNSFTKLIAESQGAKNIPTKEENKPKSERYLETSSHYNDVKVPREMQNQIGAKVSAVIWKNIEFVDVEQKLKKPKVKGGVKLFTNSENFLSCEEAQDTYTESHNRESKKMKKRRREVECDDLDEDEKLNAVAVSGEYVLSKEDTKSWKSRRKEKLFKYKSHGKSKVLTAVE